MTQDPEADFIRRYTSDVACLLRQIDPGPIIAAVSVLYGAWQTGKVVLFCGNGGSGASCSHIVNDFQKNAGLKSICLSDCTPLLTAYANDTKWEQAFRWQVQTWKDAGALVAVSGSGNSSNVLGALVEARSQRMKTIALTGFDGGAVKDTADISIHVPTESMQQAEDVHMIVLHMLFVGLQRRIKSA